MWSVVEALERFIQSPPVLGALFKQSAQGLTPDAALKWVRQALKEAWPNKDLARLQHHSVNTRFTKSGIDFDVVPAYELPDPQVYLIPEREGGTWIRTNPRLHQQLSTEANERSGKKLKPLLKAVKHWNRRHDSSSLRSFHLEAMSYGALPRFMEGYLEPLEVLFSQLARLVLRPCPDPARLGPDVDARMSSTQRGRPGNCWRARPTRCGLRVRRGRRAPSRPMRACGSSSATSTGTAEGPDLLPWVRSPSIPPSSSTREWLAAPAPGRQAGWDVHRLPGQAAPEHGAGRELSLSGGRRLGPVAK